jgi:peptidoglycan hydrolase-like protein with peptidoglycan-binding domain
MYYAWCPFLVTESGLPFTVALNLGTAPWCDSPRPTLRPEPAVGVLTFGDEGQRVRSLQEQLSTFGLLLDTIDGQFGPNTRAAVCDLQHLAELPVTCDADESVLDILGL